MKANTSLLLSLLVFLFSLGIGFYIASKKGLWQDENFALVQKISYPSYTDILTTNFEGGLRAGNITPFYYFSSKLIIDSFGYKVPKSLFLEQSKYNEIKYGDPDFFKKFRHGAPMFYDDRGQIIFRILPVFCISLAISFIFYFFSQAFSLLAAAYSLIISLSTFMLWAHWAEARHYAPWLLFTTMQLLLFLCFLHFPKWKEKVLSIFLVQLLLSCTIILSVFQIFIFSLMSFLVGIRSWKIHFWITFVPIAICLVYRSLSSRMGALFKLADPPQSVLLANYPMDRLFILALFISFALYLFSILKDSAKSQEIRNGCYLAFYSLLAIVSAVVLMFIFIQYKPVEGSYLYGQAPAPLSSKYFIFLTPLSIVCSSYFAILLYRVLQQWKYIQWSFMVFIAVLVVYRVYRNYWLVQSLHIL